MYRRSLILGQDYAVRYIIIILQSKVLILISPARSLNALIWLML